MLLTVFQLVMDLIYMYYPFWFPYIFDEEHEINHKINNKIIIIEFLLLIIINNYFYISIIDLLYIMSDTPKNK